MTERNHLRTAALDLALFAAGAAVTLVTAIAAGSTLAGLLGGTPPLLTMGLIGGLASGGLLLVTAAVLRRDAADLSAIGLPLDRRRLGELAAGFVATAALFLAVAWVQSVWVGAPWRFQGTRGLWLALGGLPLCAGLVLVEELLFRGVVLRELRALAGDAAAIAATALAFGVYHVIGSQHWGMGLFFQFLMPALGGLLFAWAAVRSGGLALPIGLHLGGNWIQASVAVFDVHARTGAAESIAGLWRIPVSLADVQVLTAPDLLPRLPMLAAFAIAAALTAHRLRRA